MWFGDLVTMRWFDDVWMKEVFANFFAAKIVNPSFPELNPRPAVSMAHYPSAYEIDRTEGANPIRQHLENLRDAGGLYGNIIYDKAPIAMRQLEALVGQDTFKDGLRDYLARYSFSNATWPDLISLLDQRTDEDLAAWSHALGRRAGPADRPHRVCFSSQGRSPSSLSLNRIRGSVASFGTNAWTWCSGMKTVCRPSRSN